MPLVTKARKIDPVLRGVTSKFTKYEQEIYNIYMKALSQMPKDMNNDLVRRAIREAIEAGNPMDGAFGFQWNNFVGALDKSIPTLASQLAASANISAKALPKAIQISSSFTATDPRAIAWAQQRAGARILGITQESQKAVAETIARGLQGQLNREEVIDGVTRVVGLDSRQARALGTFYEKNLNLLLEEGLTYENAARAAKKLGEKYRSRLLKQRATRIARTETNAAANAGRMLSWAEADLQGLLPVGSEKRWKTSQDERNCPTCRPMHNETVPWEGAFSTGDIMPPVHINCLCTAVIVPADAVYEKSLHTQVKKTSRNAWLFAKHGSHNQKTHGGKGGGGEPSEFVEAGGSVSGELSPRDAELVTAIETLEEMEDMLGGEFKRDVGVVFTKYALSVDEELGNRVKVASTEDGLAGAISYNYMEEINIDSTYGAAARLDITLPEDGDFTLPPPHIYINFLGSTGLIDKTGSALAQSVFKEAADRGLAVYLQSASDGASAFWTKMGLQEGKIFGDAAFFASADRIKELVAP